MMIEEAIEMAILASVLCGFIAGWILHSCYTGIKKAWKEREK